MSDHSRKKVNELIDKATALGFQYEGRTAKRHLRFKSTATGRIVVVGTSNDRRAVLNAVRDLKAASQPNIQNIPIRTPEGAAIKAALIKQMEGR